MAGHHSLLKRQLKRYGVNVGDIPAALQAFVAAVNEAYLQSDADRGMLERSMNLSSDELLRANSELRAAVQALRQSELDYRGLFEAARDAILIIDPAGETVLEANQRACVLYGFTHEEFRGLSLGAISDGASEGQWQAETAGAHPGFETVQRRKDGSLVHIEVSASVVDYNGRRSVLSINRDITERVHARAELTESLSLLSATLESTADGILVVDLRGRILTFNRRFASMWNIPDDLLESRDDDPAQDHVLHRLERPEQFLNKVRAMHSRPDAESHDLLEFTDGRVFERYSMPQRINGVSVGRVWSFRDVTKQRRAEEAIRHHAYHDDLTGLPNRPLFRDRFAQALGHAKREKQTLAMLFLDLDRFKVINDTLGHDVGDKLLQDVARRLLERKRAGDTLARLGGDEFMLLVANIRHIEDAAKVAENFLQALRPAFHVDGQELHVAASVGISLYPFDGEDVETLTKNADIALYRAKERGRNNYQIYKPAMNAMALERLMLENSLRRALERDEFVLHYQPQVDAVTGAIVGAEALVRWQRGTGELLQPAEFIPIAEDAGLIGALGAWVLRVACQEGRVWQTADGRPLRLAVNVSASQFQRLSFIGDVARLLEQTTLDPSALELELTESTIMLSPDQAIESMQALRSMGVQIAIDDFGTGYSSLSYMKRLPINALKIDQSFVRDSLSHPNDAAIVTAIISMAHSLGLRVVAEGVETEAQASFLRERGCNEMQGFLFGAPVEPDAFAHMLAGRVRDSGPPPSHSATKARD